MYRLKIGAAGRHDGSIKLSLYIQAINRFQNLCDLLTIADHQEHSALLEIRLFCSPQIPTDRLVASPPTHLLEPTVG